MRRKPNGSAAPSPDARIPFFAFPPEVPGVLYTTNALESVHAQLRKIIETRGHFSNDEAATKLRAMTPVRDTL